MSRTLFLRLLLFTCALFTLSCTTEELAEPNTVEALNDTRLEAEIMELVNSHRSTLGLGKLNFNEVAYTYAGEHNDYMIAKGSLSHDNFNQRASRISSEANAERVGENVAKDYSSAESVFNGWLKSESHKKNIEDIYTHTAISVKRNSEGDLYFTQIFFK